MECIPNLTDCDAAGRAAAVTCLNGILEHLPNPALFPALKPMTAQPAQEAVVHNNGLPLHSPGAHDPDVLEGLFTRQEIDLYGFGLRHKWSANQLRDMILMLRRPHFGITYVDPNLHERFQMLIQVY